VAEELERKSRQLEILAKESEDKERYLSREVAMLEQKVAKFDFELTEKSIQIDSILSMIYWNYIIQLTSTDMTGKSQHFDLVKSRLDKLEKEYSACSNELTLKTAQLAQALADREENTRKTIESQQKEELVKMDKVYLSKEVDTLRSKLTTLEEKVERQKRKLKDVKKTKEDLFQQLMKAREDQKTNYEQKLQAEVDRIRGQTADDLAKIRESAREVYERETRYIVMRSYWRFYRNTVAGSFKRITDRLLQSCDRISNTISMVLSRFQLCITHIV
jgi:hypothetical protein